MKVYIAGCITNGGLIPESGYKQKFANAEERLRQMGHEPVNPTTLAHDHARRWQDYMIETIHAMLDCDGVFVLPCWQRSKGATIEVQLALRLGKEVVFDSAPPAGS